MLDVLVQLRFDNKTYGEYVILFGECIETFSTLPMNHKPIPYVCAINVLMIYSLTAIRYGAL